MRQPRTAETPTNSGASAATAAADGGYPTFRLAVARVSRICIGTHTASASGDGNKFDGSDGEVRGDGNIAGKQRAREPQPREYRGLRLGGGRALGLISP